jgi:spermidine/putrescine-binding protein
MKALRAFTVAVTCVGALLSAPVGCRPKKQTLHVFTWSDYFPEEVVLRFEQEADVRVVLDTYENNEDLVAKLQTGATGYDLIVPSDYAVQQLAQLGLLEPLDAANIPNLAGVDGRFLRQYFDPHNTYSVPYLWGTAGIAYEATKVKPAPSSWAVLWDGKYADNINMLDDMREVFAVAHKRLGSSVNTTEPAAIRAAKDLLIQQKPLVRSYTTETDTLMLSGQVALTHAWSGDVFRVAEENPNWRYVIPAEGSTFFMDNIAVPKGAPHKALAETFVDFVLRPENIAAVTAFTHYANCVPASVVHLPEALRKNPLIFPSDEVLGRLESLKRLGDAEVLYGDAWTAVKSAR